MTDNKICRHEYVRIYQRRLKGLDRRLVSTKAYLPVGFKVGDFNYLGEGSYCFCSTCRQRLFPKRTTQEKALARQERKLAKLEGAIGLPGEALVGAMAHGAADDEGLLDEEGGPVYDEFDEDAEPDMDELEEDLDAGDTDDELDVEKETSVEIEDDSETIGVDVSVDELEVESVDMTDIKAEGVKIGDEDTFEEACEMDETEDE